MDVTSSSKDSHPDLSRKRLHPDSYDYKDLISQRDSAKVGSTEGRLRLFFYALGIFVCYFYYGILQEKITKGKYGRGDHTEKFTYTLALVFIQCIINALFCAILSKFTHSVADDDTPSRYYMLASITYLGAMVASNHALQYVAYPMQVLGKSVKPIPVMILGVLLAQKRYPIVKYMCVLVIVLGVALFMYKDGKATSVSHTSVIGFGEILLLVSLTLDGLTGATQDKMRNEHKTKAWPLMFNMNVWSVLWLLIALMLTGEGVSFLSFIGRYPWTLVNMLSFSLASAFGQSFIFLTVSAYGPLMCSIVTTTRKFFTILGSVLIFRNPMSSRQWLGTVLVFIGLGVDSYFGKEIKKPK